jgi:hypothetical protein
MAGRKYLYKGFVPHNRGSTHPPSSLFFHFFLTHFAVSPNVLSTSTQSVCVSLSSSLESPFPFWTSPKKKKGTLGFFISYFLDIRTREPELLWIKVHQRNIATYNQTYIGPALFEYSDTRSPSSFPSSSQINLASKESGFELRFLTVEFFFCKLPPKPSSFGHYCVGRRPIPSRQAQS